MAGAHPEYKTLWEYFQRTLKRVPNHQFLGTRKSVSDSYEWMTFREAAQIVDTLTEGLHQQKQGIEEQRFKEHPEATWRIMSMFSENRPEYVLMELACLGDSITVVPIPVRSADGTSVGVITTQV